MKRSAGRMLTTHTGSLPRPRDLVALLRDREEGRGLAVASFQTRVRSAVFDAVGKQEEPGTGQSFQAMGPVQAVEQDIQTLKDATASGTRDEVFMTSPSPGQIGRFLQNRHYPSDEAYLYTLAGVMKREYQAIVQAGFTLQVDCPDLALGRHTQFAHLTLAEFRRVAEMHVEVLNHAVADIPPDRMRMHVCWASTGGPHHRDVPLADIVDIVLKGRPAGLMVPGANPRHGHEWKVWRDVKLPAGKILIPGVIDSTTNFIEHPELVAERIERYAQMVGRENVIAGCDCGFGTFAGRVQVDTNIVWHKLRSLVEGARLASHALW
jgi:5-methyltetrahydropteroyltriglutamate--homocysteine methyltransferase